MIKYLIVFLLTLLSLNASLIKQVEILERDDINTKIKDIIDSPDFKKTVLPIKRKSDNVYFVKLTLDREKLGDTNKIIEFSTRFDLLELNEGLNFTKINNHKILNFDQKNFVENIYLKLYDDEELVKLDINVYDKEEYLLHQITIGKFFGISYGIIFAAFLYYFALYLFNRYKEYIYYSLTQFFVLCILVFLIGNNFENEQILSDLIISSFFVFSNLFTKEFLNSKKLSPIANNLLSFSLALYLVDMLIGYVFGYFFLEENLPKATLFIFYIIAAFMIYLKGYKPAFFYLLGWGVITIGFLFVDFQYYILEDHLLIHPLYLLHFIFPLESLILAFALSYKMKLFEKEKEEQQQFLTYQSKLASMGEMIGNIAHQWRQPLTHLSYILMNLKTAYEKDKLTPEYFDKKSALANAQLSYLSNTIDDFRDFFKNTKQKEIFNINEAIDEVINLLKESFKSYHINLQCKYEKEISTNGYKGEFLQVLFNILNNAKDEFIKKGIEDPKISIKLYQEKKRIIIDISDNAGGIDTKILDKIFEPYFTTKDKGLGIGLYMSKMIIERNFEGKLEADNIENGASFKIKLLMDSKP